jgi:hypothetical protein
VEERISFNNGFVDVDDHELVDERSELGDEALSPAPVSREAQ